MVCNIMAKQIVGAIAFVVVAILAIGAFHGNPHDAKREAQDRQIEKKLQDKYEAKVGELSDKADEKKERIKQASKELTPHLDEEKAYFLKNFPNYGTPFEGVHISMDPKHPRMQVNVCVYTKNDFTEDLINEAVNYLPIILNAPYKANTVVQLLYGDQSVEDYNALLRVQYDDDTDTHTAFLEFRWHQKYNLEVANPTQQTPISF